MFQTSIKGHKRKLLTTLFIVGIVLVVALLYSEQKPLSLLKGWTQSLFSKPRSFIYSIGKEEAQDELTKLKKRVSELEKQLVEFENVKKDNDALRSQFVESIDTSKSLVPAKILGFLGDNQRPHELVINVGKKDGILKDMTVIYEKYLIGKIEIVSQNYSVVMTPFNPKFQVLAKLSETGANGIVVGRSDLILLDGVLITDTLKKDGIVTTKGEVSREGIGVVPDIIIGKISSISKRETAPFQNAQVTPLVDYQKLTNIFVIAKM